MCFMGGTKSHPPLRFLCRACSCRLNQTNRVETTQDHASVSEKDERWTLRKVGVLHSLALALAQGGGHVMAEDKLLEAIRQLQELDGVDADAEDCAHKVIAVLGHEIEASALVQIGWALRCFKKESQRLYGFAAFFVFLASMSVQNFLEEVHAPQL